MKKILTVVLALAMLISLGVSSYAAGTSFTDVSGHWAESAIKTWSDRGIIQGSNGKFMPNNPITRADFAVIIDRMMGYQIKADNTFKDLGTAYYTDPILKAARYGVIKGNTDGNVQPLSNITRQDAFVMLYRALSLPAATGYTIAAGDASDVSGYATAAVATFMSLGAIQGRDGGLIAPKATITRAEVVYLLDSLFSDVYSAAGTYSQSSTGFVLVNAPGVTLKDMTVNGTLLIAPGVGAGSVDLSNVNVKGNMLIVGGSQESVKALGSTVIAGSTSILRTDNALLIMTIDNDLRVFSKDGTEFTDLTDLFVQKGSGQVLLNGVFNSVSVYTDVKVTLTDRSSIRNLYLNAPVVFSGPGTIDKVVLTDDASGASFETQPASISALEGVTLSVGAVTIISDGGEIIEGAEEGDVDAPSVQVTNVTLFVNGSPIVMTPSSNEVTFDLAGKAGSDAITGITINTSSGSSFLANGQTIATNTYVPMSTFLTMVDKNPSSVVTIQKIRDYFGTGTPIPVTGMITDGEVLTVTFIV